MTKNYTQILQKLINIDDNILYTKSKYALLFEQVKKSKIKAYIVYANINKPKIMIILI